MLTEVAPDLTIYITQKDIDEGTPGSPDACVAARALRRAIQRVAKILPIDITIACGIGACIDNPSREGHRHWFWRHSRVLDERINAFDRGEPIKPGKFVLRGLPVL